MPYWTFPHSVFCWSSDLDLSNQSILDRIFGYWRLSRGEVPKPTNRKLLGNYRIACEARHPGRGQPDNRFSRNVKNADFLLAGRRLVGMRRA